MSTDTADVIRKAAAWFEPDADGFGSLFESLEDAHVVLIGEATHGTEDKVDPVAAAPARYRYSCFEDYGEEPQAYGDQWGEPAQRMRVRASLPGSYERLFHDVGISQFALLLDDPNVGEALRDPRLERAIGVIYRPDTERVSHYLPARLSEQFDAVMHIDDTRALEPLERWSRDEIDLPETYPSAL